MEIAVLNSLHSVTANPMQEVVSHFAQVVAMVYVRCHGFLPFCRLVSIPWPAMLIIIGG